MNLTRFLDAVRSEGAMVFLGFTLKAVKGTSMSWYDLYGVEFDAVAVQLIIKRP